MIRAAIGLAAVVALVVGCASTPVSPAPTTSAGPQASATASQAGTVSSAPPATPSATSSSTPATPAVDLSARPLIWFAPLPPLPTGPGRPYTGSDDFMDLFADGAPWARAAARTHVFKLYGEWVAYSATDAQLRAAVEGIAARGMVLAVEMGPLDHPPECGEGVESFAGLEEARRISRRIREAGGRLDVVAMDEPWYFAHVYDGPNACRWPVDRVAEGVAAFVATMRAEWPAIVIGDTEPMPSPVSAAGLAEWLDAYEAAVGEPAGFLHLDMDWSRPSWPALAADVRRAGSERGVPVGMIYNGGAATSDAQWVAVAGRRVLADEAEAGGAPEHVLFQSWMDKPDHALPETEPTTFTALVNRYLDDHASLAQVPGAPANLALGRPAKASSALGDAGPSRAVDGDSDSIWNAGAGPPAWLEVDLGRGARVSEIRLLVAQSPAGRTRHRVTCAATSGGTRRVVADLRGATAELDVLRITPDAPVACRLLRIETLASPSWVAWREVEVDGTR